MWTDRDAGRLAIRKLVFKCPFLPGSFGPDSGWSAITRRSRNGRNWRDRRSRPIYLTLTLVAPYYLRATSNIHYCLRQSLLKESSLVNDVFLLRVDERDMASLRRRIDGELCVGRDRPSRQRQLIVAAIHQVIVRSRILDPNLAWHELLILSDIGGSKWNIYGLIPIVSITMTDIQRFRMVGRISGLRADFFLKRALGPAGPRTRSPC